MAIPIPNTLSAFPISCGMHSLSCRDQIADGSKLTCTDALGIHQVFRVEKGAVCFPLVDDRLRNGRADAWECIQFSQCGGIDVDMAFLMAECDRLYNRFFTG